ncbi:MULTISPECIES: ParA family protein [Amycolatopsis]|uniref:CobQ/CobB/MinD/ParA nucleotide binding domain-containing protein n=1 Tax=Amycolatopsis saalfeldensis TaxID=394193 RepID=A0A1H8YND9_9PSEU|nr:MULTISPECIES: AAA family ATPase [Amycolatopsis]SEP53700.1 CobQ/CobB/MinD/ParA nucleotide binding domain-containing protein [Amycolatopsis saalfeldensis]
MTEATSVMKVSAQERLSQAVARYIEETPLTAPVEFGTVGEAGSAGKTTALVTYAALLAQLGFEVEVVDLDGQGNASKHFGIGVSDGLDDGDKGDGLLVLGKEYSPGVKYPAPLVLGDALLRRKAQFPGEDEPRAITLDDIRRCAYNESGIPGYGVVVPSSDANTIAWLKRIHIYPNGPSYVTGEKIDFYRDEAELAASDPLAGMLLSRRMDKVQSAPHFRGYDLHGTKSMSMMSALVRLKRAINCVLLDDKTTGVDLTHLKETITSIQEYNPDLRLSMILPCRVKASSQRGKFGQEMLDRLRKRHGEIVPDVEIREAVTVSEAYNGREPLPMWVPRDPVTDDFRNSLAWAFENGVFAP